MDTGLNPALQAILDSLNESSSRPSEASSINNETCPSIPGLGFLPDAETSVPPAPKPRMPEPKSRTVTPVPNVSSITTWPAAMKHITKYIASNEIIGAKIRQLITDQHKHETQWWAGREAIIKRHKSRGRNQQQASDLLKAIGGFRATLRPINDSTEKAEVESYDKKVYGELIKMTASYDKQLRSMGIPFYAIKHELVILEQGHEKASSEGRIDRGELRELQKRMLRHLEDLFLEDG
jgi:hypothetical protein